MTIYNKPMTRKRMRTIASIMEIKRKNVSEAFWQERARADNKIESRDSITIPFTPSDKLNPFDVPRTLEEMMESMPRRYTPGIGKSLTPNPDRNDLLSD
jgi:hypothetical protein